MLQLIVQGLLIDLANVEIMKLLDRALLWILNNADIGFIVRGRQIVIEFAAHGDDALSHAFPLVARHSGRLLV